MHKELNEIFKRKKKKIRAGTCAAFKKAVVSYFLTVLIVSN